MENFERRTFPTTVKTLDGKKRVPTEAELDRLLFELVKDKLGGAEKAAPEPAVPTDAELRQQAAELGITLPPTYLDTVRAESRDLMLACLRGADVGPGER